MSGTTIVQDLLVRYFERVDGGEEASEVEADLTAAHPEVEAEFRRSIGLLRGAGLERTAVARGAPQRLGEFTILRRIGGGGMGVVYLARQESVQREVALKVIRGDQLYFEGVRTRFRREAEIVAGLAHPNIAAVHAFGVEGDVPFCAMEYVPGASLDEALRRLVGNRVESLKGADLRSALAAARAHGAPSTLVDPGLFDGTWTAACLRVAREVALALVHAHERGVLHRDVKPSNVVVTSGGRVVLLDFGLAGWVEAHGLTQSGAAMGSLPYMAPEQAAGRTRDVGVQADVYGLGVTLYELLALRPAFAGKNVEATRAAILEGATLPLRKLNAELPRDVEVVVARAMDPDLKSRYASASELARDLENLLERRPIVARPIGRVERGWRYARRKPAVVLAAGLALLLLTVVPASVAWQKARHADALELTLEETDAHFESAVSAIGEVLRPLADARLDDVPGAQQIRVDTFREALALIEDLASWRPEDRWMRAETASLHASLGNALALEGHLDGALDELHTASTIWDRLLDEEGAETDPYHVRGALGTYLPLARFALLAGRVDLGLQAFDRCDELAAGLATRLPGDPTALLMRARVSTSRADLEDSTGLVTCTEAELTEAERIAAILVATTPKDPEAHALMGLVLEARADRLFPELGDRQGLEPAHVELLARALESLDRAVELGPEMRTLRDMSARYAVRLGRACKVAGQIDRAEALARRGEEEFDWLIERFPEVPDYRSGRLQALDLLAAIAYARGGIVENAEAMSRLAEEREVLAGLDVGEGPLHMAATIAHINAAGALLNAWDLGDERIDRADEHLVRAGAMLDAMGDNHQMAVREETASFLDLTRSNAAAARGDLAGALMALESACAKGDVGDAQRAGMRAECFAVLFQEAPYSAPESEPAREGAVRWIVRALELGYPAYDLLGGDYFRELREDPRVLAAVNAQVSAD